MTKTLFKDIVAYVVCSEAANASKADINKQLKQCGATISTRLTKAVTHCVFVEGDSDAELQSDLLGLYKRVDALTSSPVVVGSSWIEQCIAKKRKLSETKYILPCPKDEEQQPAAKTRRIQRTRSTLQEDGIGQQTQAVADILANDLPVHNKAAPTKGKSRLSKVSGPSSQENAPPAHNADKKPNSRNKNIIRVGNIEGAAQRFSVRQLQRQGEKPVLLHKGTPWDGAMPPATIQQSKKNRPIYIPGVERVESPWNAATPPDEILAQQEVVAPYGSLSESKPEKKGRKSSINTPWSHLRAISLAQGRKVPSPWTAVRPWDNPSSGRPSLLSGRQPSQHDVTPVSIQQNPRTSIASLKGRKLSVASQLGGNTTNTPSLLREVKQNTTAITTTTNIAKNNTATTTTKQQQQQSVVDKENMTAAHDANRLKRKHMMDTTTTTGQQDKKLKSQTTTTTQRKPLGVHGQQQQQYNHQSTTEKQHNTNTINNESIPTSIRPSTPSIGHIAVTSTTSSVIDLVKSAVRRLRGIRICPDGQEESSMTHLIIGDERRTLKTMLAVANGAWMLSPEWVTASLEAGYWLPEEQYTANVRFARGAERARKHLAAQGYGAGNTATPTNQRQGCKRLLSDQSIYVHLSSKTAARNAVALKRLAQALGAKYVKSASNCTVCVVAGKDSEVKRPSGLPSGVPIVEEEWLLQAAENYEVISTRRFAVATVE